MYRRIVSECIKLAQSPYKRGHDNVTKIVHWRLCEKYGLERTQKWYEHKSEGINANNKYKVLWDFTTELDLLNDSRKPNIFAVDDCKKEAKIINITIHGDARVGDQELEKIEKYKLQNDEITRMWVMKKETVNPIVVGAPGSLTNRFEKI
ncbi:uncharacterized protein LOC115215409 [Octopus sinensis]|uniref:Uncharacterized protein LOC115215409 n=1 Tax=Octopus sinensis TaxID=2607531 RepID=A0A6P7SPX0_9MOLL|nr:uncharacterized protein LOC115215409 [Octopus sinensis]